MKEKGDEETAGPHSPDVSVVIVNWNGKHLLGECLDSLTDQKGVDAEIILVDNGSRDGSVEYVREYYPEIRIIGLSENRGFAGGNNSGIKAASGTYIALLNNDTKAGPGWLESLVRDAQASPPSVGMWACKILSYNHPDRIDNTGLMLYPDGLGRGRGRLEQDRGQYDKPGEALFPSGCAGLFRREMLAKIGLFDEDFFAYADDVDIGLRARLAGWGCRYVPTAVVYHKYSSSSSAYSPFKAFLVERNRIRVMIKYYPPELILSSPWFTLIRLVLQLFGALTGKGASGKFAEDQSVLKAMKILVRAWMDTIVNLPAALKQRRTCTAMKRIGRAEIYRLFCTYRLSAREIALKE